MHPGPQGKISLSVIISASFSIIYFDACVTAHTSADQSTETHDPTLQPEPKRARTAPAEFQQELLNSVRGGRDYVPKCIPVAAPPSEVFAAMTT